MTAKEQIVRNLSNLPGWHTDRKIVVIESDDWGSVRMPSRAAFQRLEKQGVSLLNKGRGKYNLYDHLATADDLLALYNVLSSFSDKNKKSPVFTAVSVVANPDFEKIKASGYQNYFFEPFTETLKNTKGCENSFDLWKEGIQNHLFIPQFHGREHLNVAVWMRALQNNDFNTLTAFNESCWGFNNRNKFQISYQAAFELESPSDLENQKEIVRSGLRLFQQIFGYKASFFVPPNGPFNNELGCIAADEGIKYMSTHKIQKESLGDGKTSSQFHWLGQKNKIGQIYITRNCFFEPSQEGKDWMDNCMSDINIAFRWHKPAVISSHRVNYIGSLDIKNRDRGLNGLNRLLLSITTKWPEVEFMTSNELGDLIVKK